MPEISRFLGIVITMYAEAGMRHNTPHFHVRYNEHKAVFEIPSGDLLAGSLPKSQRRLVEAWVELRRTELEKDWALMLAGRLPNKVTPLE